jgi:hypothetical protein
MTNNRRIEVASLRTASDVRGAIDRMQDNRGRARDFVWKTFGEDVLNSMLRIGELIPDGRPTLVLSRQIAKPDMQYASTYLAAKRLGYSMLTLEWTDDQICMDPRNYKRTYIKLPLGAIGRSGSLFSKGVDVVDPKLVTAAEVSGKKKIKDFVVRPSSIAEFKDAAALLAPGLVNGEMDGGGDISLRAFYANLRSVMRIGGEPATDILSEMAIRAAYYLRAQLERKDNAYWRDVPGFGDTKWDDRFLKGDRHATWSVEKVNGQLVNVLVFALQNLVPNLVLAVTDWNGDDRNIQDRYLTAVQFLESNGLRPPLQTFIPSMSDGMAEKAVGTTLGLDSIVPMTSRIAELAGQKPSEEIDENIIDAGRSIVKLMREERSARSIQ